MKEQTRASPEKVWHTWERAHQGPFVSGSIGYMQQGKRKISYQLLDVVPGKSFSILWKALFVRLIFSHKVTSSWAGSEIEYDVQITGPFGWMVRWLLAPKIRKHLSLVLKAFVKQLEVR